MASYIRCPECGFCIGKYMEFIDEAKKAMTEEVVFDKNSTYADYDPEKIIFKPSVVPELGPIFDVLGIRNRCCRIRLTTKTDFDKRYK